MSELRSLVSAFGPVDLDQVEARAALSVRTDRKYVLDAVTFARLAEQLAEDHLALEVGGQRLRAYDSIYFDTPDLSSYRQHLQGRRRRFKCRTRLYADGGRCFFEVKLRGSRGETVKRRLELPAAAHGELLHVARRFLTVELDALYGLDAPCVLAATVATSYTRLSLVAGDERERVTCDFGLTLRAGEDRHEILPGQVLVETKTALGNGVADRQLRRLGVRPVESCSKYCLGVALTHPDVRDNSFRRLIRRHFRGAGALGQPQCAPAFAEGL
jgi:hypothetical protein